MTKLPTSSDQAEHFALVATSLTKRFRGTGNETFVAVDDVSLHVSAGTVVGILGSNGAGKSTLLSLIAGTTAPDSGSVIVAGRDITMQPSWKRTNVVARVRQNPADNMLSSLTIEDNFSLALARRGRRKFPLRRAGGLATRKAAQELLAPLGMGLEDRLHTVTGSLSGGQRQAVAMVLASTGSPSVMLLDEHTAALDVRSARKVDEITRQLVNDSSVATLMVTHNMDHALRMSNRLLMMHHGRVVLDLDAAAITELTPVALADRFAEIAGEALPDTYHLTG